MFQSPVRDRWPSYSSCQRLWRGAAHVSIPRSGSVALILNPALVLLRGRFVSIPRSGSVALILPNPRTERPCYPVSIPRSGSVALIHSILRGNLPIFCGFNPPFGIGGPHTCSWAQWSQSAEGVSIPRSGSVALILAVFKASHWFYGRFNPPFGIGGPHTQRIAKIGAERDGFNPPFGIGGPHTSDYLHARLRGFVSIPRSGSVALIPLPVAQTLFSSLRFNPPFGIGGPHTL